MRLLAPWPNLASDRGWWTSHFSAKPGSRHETENPESALTSPPGGFRTSLEAFVSNEKKIPEMSWVGL